MKGKLASTKRKRLLLATGIICAVLAAGSVMWFTRQTVEAAVLYPYNPGLVGWWRFDEGSGTVAGDNSGNGNDGTVDGASWVAGKFGDALSFGGTASVEIDDVELPFSQPYTVSVWVNASAYADMFLFGRINDVHWYVYFGADGTINDWASGDGLDWHPNVPYDTGQWQYFAFVYNGTGKTIYRNGVSVASTTQASTGGSGLYVGRHGYPGYTVNEFQGVVDEVKIYNRTLSASEILANFQGTAVLPSTFLAKVPKDTTEFIATVSWQGTESINVTIESPSQNYTEDSASVRVYQKTTYSTYGGTSGMLNIKRVEVSTAALASAQDWYVALAFDNVVDYKITVEIQK
jgi:hypothetical protein